MTVRAVLFDFAGTLFARRSARDSVELAAAELGLVLAERERDRLAEGYLAAGLPGGPYPAHVPRDLQGLYALRDLGPAEHRAAYEALLATVPGPDPRFAAVLYRQVRDPSGWIPYADARPTIDALAARGIAAGVVSNIGFDLRPILSSHGLGVLASHCTLSFEAGAAKPDPAIFEAALSTLGSKPEETLMVGDHPEADGAAAALGMPILILPMSPPGAVHGLAAILDRLA